MLIESKRNVRVRFTQLILKPCSCFVFVVRRLVRIQYGQHTPAGTQCHRICRIACNAVSLEHMLVPRARVGDIGGGDSVRAQSEAVGHHVLIDFASRERSDLDQLVIDRKTFGNDDRTAVCGAVGQRAAVFSGEDCRNGQATDNCKCKGVLRVADCQAPYVCCESENGRAL